ncbi:MAG: DMT family transporter [Bacteroidales bacterium]|nr:DMT family transporter [Bacteroidales bacterium]
MYKHMPKYLALIIGLFFMSSSAIFIKKADAAGIVTAFYRMMIAAIVLLVPFLFMQFRSKSNLPYKGILLASLAGICFGIDMSLWSTGIVASNATIPTIFANTAPVWVGFGSMIFFREKHGPGFWIGLLIAFSGIPVLLMKDFSAPTGILFGSMMGAGAGFFYGTFQVLSQPGRQLLNTLSYLFISTFSSAVVLFIAMIIFNYPFTGYNTQTTIIFFAYSIGVQVFGWFLINYAQGHMPASIVAPTLLGQPVITAFLAILLLREQLTIWHITGGLVIIAGIYLVHFTNGKLRKRNQEHKMQNKLT